MNDKHNPVGLFVAAVWVVSGIFLYVACAPISGNYVDITSCDHGDKNCVIDAVMATDEKPDDMFTFMEGYVPTDLHSMLDTGRLTINEINPLLPIMATVAVGALAYAYVEQGEHGDMYRVDTYYPSWYPTANYLLAHELKHARGVADWGVWGSKLSYNDKQKTIMQNEGVSRWVDTTYYKYENPLYHRKNQLSVPQFGN